MQQQIGNFIAYLGLLLIIFAALMAAASYLTKLFAKKSDEDRIYKAEVILAVSRFPAFLGVIVALLGILIANTKL